MAILSISSIPNIFYFLILITILIKISKTSDICSSKKNPLSSYDCISTIIDENYKCCLETYTYKDNVRKQCMSYTNSAAEFYTTNIFYSYSYICPKPNEYFNQTQFYAACTNEQNATNCLSTTFQEHLCCQVIYSDKSKTNKCKAFSKDEVKLLKNSNTETYLCNSNKYIIINFLVHLIVLILFIL